MAREGWGLRAGTERASWAHLVHDLGEGLLQFAVHDGQLLVVTVGFQDGDEGFVDLVHRLVEPALGVEGWGGARIPSMSGFQGDLVFPARNSSPSVLLPILQVSLLYLPLQEARLDHPPPPTPDGAPASLVSPNRPLHGLHLLTMNQVLRTSVFYP